MCTNIVYMLEVKWQMTKQKAVRQQNVGSRVVLCYLCSLPLVLILDVNVLKCDFSPWSSCAHSEPYTLPVLQILIHVGFLTEESGDVFSPKVLKGGPLGEMVQWADILTALHVLGHNLKISMSVKELQGWVPLGGRCWGLQREFLLGLSCCWHNHTSSILTELEIKYVSSGILVFTWQGCYLVYYLNHSLAVSWLPTTPDDRCNGHDLFWTPPCAKGLLYSQLCCMQFVFILKISYYL